VVVSDAPAGHRDVRVLGREVRKIGDACADELAHLLADGLEYSLLRGSARDERRHPSQRGLLRDQELRIVDMSPCRHVSMLHHRVP